MSDSSQNPARNPAPSETRTDMTHRRHQMFPGLSEGEVARISRIESGASGPVLIGTPGAPDVLRLQSFLRRNGHPHHVVDASTDADAAALLAQYGCSGLLVVCPDGSMLDNPSEEALARCM